MIIGKQFNYDQFDNALPRRETTYSRFTVIPRIENMFLEPFL